MLTRYKTSPSATFQASQLNTTALAEVLTGDDSAFFRDLEVFVTATGEWKCLSQAFRDRDVIVDNYNTCFFEPKTDEERRLGYRE